MLCIGKPFKTDVINGVLAYGVKGGNELDMSSFGIPKSDLVPEALGGPEGVAGSFTFGDDRAYLGSMLAAPVLANRSKFKTKSNKLEASLSLYARIWNGLSNQGDQVGDMCCGSGAGAIAAMLLGRNCLAVDNNPDQVFFSGKPVISQNYYFIVIFYRLLWQSIARIA
jgi:hypothetical protein